MKKIDRKTFEEIIEKAAKKINHRYVLVNSRSAKDDELSLMDIRDLLRNVADSYFEEKSSPVANSYFEEKSSPVAKVLITCQKSYYH